MTHFGVICPTHARGHLNTMLPLGQELKRRGHRVTFMGIVGYEAKVLAGGLEFIGYGQKEFLPGAMTENMNNLSQLSGKRAFRHVLNSSKKSANALLEDAPQLIKDAGIEALLVDSVQRLQATAIAELLEIPLTDN